MALFFLAVAKSDYYKLRYLKSTICPILFYIQPGLYFIKDKNILKSDVGIIMQCYNIGLLFLSQT